MNNNVGSDNVIEFFRVEGVRAGFTTRRFSVFLKRTDDLKRAENQGRILEEFKEIRMRSFVFLEQVHGGRVAAVEAPVNLKPGKFRRLAKTDAVITNVRGLGLLVLTADCLPIFFVAPGWVGLAHAGWRGTRKRIALKTFNLLKEKSEDDGRRIRIFFGPSINAAHYEVGPEFRDYFKKGFLREKNGRLYFDLMYENRRQLLEAGVPAGHFREQGGCTFSRKDDFYSFRREGQAAGRMISFIGMVK